MASGTHTNIVILKWLDRVSYIQIYIYIYIIVIYVFISKKKVLFDLWFTWCCKRSWYPCRANQVNSFNSFNERIIQFFSIVLDQRSLWSLWHKPLTSVAMLSKDYCVKFATIWLLLFFYSCRCCVVVVTLIIIIISKNLSFSGIIGGW